MSFGCSVCGGTGYIRYKMWTGSDTSGAGEPGEPNMSVPCDACSFVSPVLYPLGVLVKPSEKDKIRDNLRRSYLERGTNDR